MNPSRVLLILLLYSEYKNKEALVCSLMSHLRYIWDVDSVFHCWTFSSMIRKEVLQLALQRELMAYTTLVLWQVLKCHRPQQGGSCLEYKKQLQLSNTKGAILVSVMLIWFQTEQLSGESSTLMVHVFTVTFRTTASPGVLNRIIPLLSAIPLILSPLFPLTGRMSKL